ncbi:alkylhydroperoxide reductase [Haloferula helveola]|uniref:Alkylhydroperoxide reductase n=1 Tax=Haloferula helveola TaxID=490095 RepID=A0ABM7RFJ4_9BACT|nr:alkylhydroperoxide reductase [Haloferula helveola]
MKPALLSLVLVSSAFAAEPPPVLPIGSPAPDFTLPGIDGKDHSLSDFKDSKVLCLIFTCNHCPDAVAARGRMQEIHEDYADKGVAMVAINGNNPIGLRPDELGYSPYGDSFEEMKPFAEESGWTFPYLYDGETQSVTQAYGGQSTPHVFVFGPDRKLRYTGRMDDAGRSSGPVEKSYLRDALDAVLADKEVATPKTRSFGCSTKWLWKKDAVAKDQEAWEKREVVLEPMDVELAKKVKANDAGVVRLINFWSTTCAPCMAEFPDLVETYRRFQNRPFDMVTISLDPEAAAKKAEGFLKKQHAAVSPRSMDGLKKEGRTTINYRFSGENPDLLAEAIDPEWSGAQPHSVILSPKGEIVWRHTGRVEPVELRRQVLKAINDAEGE